MTIDHKVIWATIGNDLEAIRECAGEFVAVARTTVAEIARAAENLDLEAVRSASHSLKGSAALFGAHDLKLTCSCLETGGRDADWPAIHDLMHRLPPLLTKVEAGLADFLIHLPGG
jgi:HPt (histidine-containing phosphotransfer) domain-containing protein